MSWVPRSSAIRWTSVALATALVVGWLMVRRKEGPSNAVQPVPYATDSQADAPEIRGVASKIANSGPRPIPMRDVLDLARRARENLIANINDYTATMVKHEQDRGGKLQPPAKMFLKVRTRHQNGTLGHPLAVYLRFESPEAFSGREVIWVENANEGHLLVREAGFVGTMMTARLDPAGFLAMQGQRYPIQEIGLTNLVEKLIERGVPDQDNPEVNVSIDDQHEFDYGIGSLIRIERLQPNGEPDDFSLAEIVIDPERQLIVQFRSFGWPKAGDDSRPLIESYTYQDIQLNVGLTEADFDPANPAYTFVE